MRTNNWPMREIVARRYYRPKGFPRYTGCVELTLSCGHTEFRKRSRDPDRTARCWNCHLDSLMPEPKDDHAGPDQGCECRISKTTVCKRHAPGPAPDQPEREQK